MAPPKTPTRREWLDDARDRLRAIDAGAPHIVAQCLLGSALELSRATLIAHDDVALSPDRQAIADEMLRRRIERREPLSYILGQTEFYGLMFTVTPDVLVPRNDTETVVAAALAAVRELETTRPDEPWMVVEVGTGSGAIAVALAATAKGGNVLATEISEPAALVARENAWFNRVEERVTVMVGDLFSPLLSEPELQGRVDVVVSNPPYVAEHERSLLPPESRLHEPIELALICPSGFDVHERLLREAPNWLRAGGKLILEIGSDQAVGLLKRAAALGAYSADVEVMQDLAKLDRCVVLTKQ